jgi:hypothetical protein
MDTIRALDKATNRIEKYQQKCETKMEGYYEKGRMAACNKLANTLARQEMRREIFEAQTERADLYLTQLEAPRIKENDLEVIINGLEVMKKDLQTAQENDYWTKSDDVMEGIYDEEEKKWDNVKENESAYSPSTNVDTIAQDYMRQVKARVDKKNMSGVEGKKAKRFIALDGNTEKVPELEMLAD